ncbi:MAG: twin-arginine translocase TatA/TatE family subunit [Alphaproteobacteria bacterium]|nr:twin-arginine translocase TatA/TatE family subunit [Alphaproteobacteria bacterium]
MGSFSIWHWLIVLVVVLLLFGGRGKIPSLMADVAKGIKSFKTSMKDDKEGTETAAAKQIEGEPAQDKATKS